MTVKEDAEKCEALEDVKKKQPSEEDGSSDNGSKGSAVTGGSDR